MCLQQTVVFLQGDRKFPISALTQPTADARGKSSNVNKPLGRLHFLEACVLPQG